jgi:uncharacterized damage-inducible protein DinB
MTTRASMFAAYNAWANRRIYDDAAALSDADYRADKGAFFGSLHGTLNHLLVADLLWMRRFTGEGDTPSRLDEILHDDLASLRAAREREDARIIAYAATLDAATLAATIRYRTLSSPTEIAQPLAPAIDHFFNHQTHHRGQAHCLLTILTGRAPVLDLLYFQRETGLGLAPSSAVT